MQFDREWKRQRQTVHHAHEHDAQRDTSRRAKDREPQSFDEQLLQQIAQISEGAYYNAASQQDLRAIYENLGLQLVIKPEDTEVTALFAGASVLLLLIGGICSMLWLSRVP